MVLIVVTTIFYIYFVELSILGYEALLILHPCSAKASTSGHDTYTGANRLDLLLTEINFLDTHFDQFEACVNGGSHSSIENQIKILYVNNQVALSAQVKPNDL